MAALAWFSSTVHLSTLAVLQVYLIDHPRIREWRVAGMLVVMVLLASGLVFSSAGQDNSLPLNCPLLTYGKDIGKTFLDSLSVLCILVILAVSYGNNIVPLYSSSPDWDFETWLVRLIRFLLGRSGGRDNIDRTIIAASGE